MKKTQPLKLGSPVILPATYEGLTEDGLVIVSVGTIDNYIITLDPKDVQDKRLMKPAS